MGINGKDLKSIRLAESLTQEEFGKLLDVSRSTISRYESSKVSIPLDHQKLICNIASGLIQLNCSHLQPGLICILSGGLCVNRDCHFKARIKRNTSWN